MLTTNFPNEPSLAALADPRPFPAQSRLAELAHLPNVELSLRHVRWQLPRFKNPVPVREKRLIAQLSDPSENSENRLPKIRKSLAVDHSFASKLKERLIEESNVSQKLRHASFLLEKPVVQNQSYANVSQRKQQSKSMRPRERLEPISFATQKLENDSARYI